MPPFLQPSFFLSAGNILTYLQLSLLASLDVVDTGLEIGLGRGEERGGGAGVR